MISDCQWLRLEGDCSYERVRRGILVAMEMLCILTVPVSVSACDIVLMLKCFFFFPFLKKIFLNLFLIGGKLLYNVVLVSAIQQ